MGQKRPVQVYILVTEETIEENLLGTLSAKHELALATLDTDSDVDALDLVNGTNELKNRLEVLLGRKPDAHVDESERTRQTSDAEQLARRAKVSLAAGELLGAAFGFLDELLPNEGKRGPESQRLAEVIHQRLEECLERDSDGRPKLTVTFPDPAALERLSGSLAHLLAMTPAGGG